MLVGFQLVQTIAERGRSKLYSTCRRIIYIDWLTSSRFSMSWQPDIVFLEKPLRVRVMLFNATSNNVSIISWQSVLLVEETEVPGENHQPVANHWQTLSHNVVSSTSRLRWIRTHSALMGQVVVNPTIIRSRPRRYLSSKNDNNKMMKRRLLFV